MVENLFCGFETIGAGPAFHSDGKLAMHSVAGHVINMQAVSCRD